MHTDVLDRRSSKAAKKAQAQNARYSLLSIRHHDASILVPVRR